MRVAGAADPLRTSQIFDRLGEEIPARERIPAAAADLMHTRGVAATTLDDVRAASGTSNSRLHHHVVDKQALIDPVIVRQSDELLEAQRRRLQSARDPQCSKERTR